MSGQVMEAICSASTVDLVCVTTCMCMAQGFVEDVCSLDGVSVIGDAIAWATQASASSADNAEATARYICTSVFVVC